MLLKLQYAIYLNFIGALNVVYSPVITDVVLNIYSQQHYNKLTKNIKTDKLKNVKLHNLSKITYSSL